MGQGMGIVPRCEDSPGKYEESFRTQIKETGLVVITFWY